MSKPMVITFPFVLLLLDYWPLGRIKRSPSRHFACPAAGVVTLAGGENPAVRSFRGQRRHHDAGAASRWSNAFHGSIFSWSASGKRGRRIRHVFVEDDLAVAPRANLSASWRLFGFLANMDIAVSACWRLRASRLKYRPKRYLLAGWLWFLGTLVPVIGLVQVGDQAMADRYAYIPLIGIFVMIAWGASDLAAPRKLGVTARVFPAACILLALSVATRRQLDYWSSELRSVDARRGRDRPKFHCARQSGWCAVADG